MERDLLKEAEQRREFTKIKHLNTKVISHDILSDANFKLGFEDFAENTNRMVLET